MTKPIILAICGKSASGKDSLAKWITKYFQSMNINTHCMISETTRPPRDYEEDGKDYYFTNRENFMWGVVHNQFLEWTNFRGWYYGVNKTEVCTDVNVGVFNPQGLKSLKKYRTEAIIIPIYLDDNLWTRLRRSHDRERKWKIEYFRRAFADWKAFKKIELLLNGFPYYIILQNVDGVTKRTRQILYFLNKWKIWEEEW